MQPGDTTGDTKTGKCSVSRNAKGNRSYSRAADHGTRFFNVPDLTSSVKRRLLALTTRRFVRSADRRGADPSPGADVANHSLIGSAVALPRPVALRRDLSRLSKRK